MREAERVCFVGDFADSEGRRIAFRVWAVDHQAAEEAVERIGVSGRIAGLLVGEGTGWPASEVGNA